MEGVGAIVGVVVLLFFLSTFGWTGSSPPAKPHPRVAADPACVSAWNQAVPPAARHQYPYWMAPGAERTAWVLRRNGVCIVGVEGGQQWELGPRGWSGTQARLPFRPNAMAAPDTTLRPAP